ncbi:hypothetical protein PR202_gb24279 [Eleusine coracana subsp. coracana]|uniref:F-box domain-containing protein n=1 Tax=Eleusine coracana subsp. coracana TaxID=191504 RepID=A0AAV5FL56_ELECO|nr:hypothetical protein QOZ80_5BG0446470 [Eleusine coracana subsp. coracana]GJN35496.1 hypothetical protein PR202_gb24279 [Eleusine coracana subsp. coracana]
MQMQNVLDAVARENEHTVQAFSPPDSRITRKRGSDQPHPRLPCSGGGGCAHGNKMANDVLPDDVLHLILLRLDSPLWLIRAASACKRWRRAVAGDDGGASFLRLARSLHPPAIAGRYHKIFGPSPIDFVPSSPPPHAKPSRFSSLGFLAVADMSELTVVDCNGGLVLLVDYNPHAPGFVVCDPLTRRHRVIGVPPKERGADYFLSYLFLLHGEDGDISISNFRVFYRFTRHSFRRACVYVSTADDGGGEWRSLWRRPGDLNKDYSRGQHLAGRVDGSLYIGLVNCSILVLDNASLEFSEVDLPTRISVEKSFDIIASSSFRVVHGVGDHPGLPPMSRIVHVRNRELEVFRREHDGSGKWVLEHSSVIPLSTYVDTPLQFEIVDVIADGTGYFILATRVRRLCFSVDLKTMKLTAVPRLTYCETETLEETFTVTLPWPMFMRA